MSKGLADREVLRETITMALYISLSLLALLAAIPSEREEGRASLAAVIALTAAGLVFAHTVAFRMSDRLVNRDNREGIPLIGAQVVGGVIGTAVAVVPLMLFDSIAIVEGALLAFVIAVAILTARAAGRTWPRTVLYAGGIVIVVLAVLVLKALVGH